MCDHDIAAKRARPGALPPPDRRAPCEGPLPQVREAPARAPSHPVRAVHREAASGRPRALPPAGRRARRPGPVPEVREAPAGARAQPVRAVRGEEPCRRAGPRDARLRAAGIPRRDPEKARIADRRRRERQVAERREAGLCLECGKAPPAPESSLCGPCGEERRAAARARYAKGKVGGKLYGGRKVETRRRIGRELSAKRLATARRGAVHELRQAALGGGRHPVRALPRGTPGVRARTLRLAPGRGLVRQLRGADPRRRLALRSVRGARDRAPLAREEERLGPPALREAPGEGPLHRLRRALAGGGPVRAACAPVV